MGSPWKPYGSQKTSIEKDCRIWVVKFNLVLRDGYLSSLPARKLIRLCSSHKVCHEVV